jgi:hypothetical protein
MDRLMQELPAIILTHKGIVPLTFEPVLMERLALSSSSEAVSE